MKIKTATLACVLGLACNAAFAQSSFAEPVIAERFTPDHGILAMDADGPGRSGPFPVVNHVHDFRSFAFRAGAMGDLESNRHADGPPVSLGWLHGHDTSSFRAPATGNSFDDGLRQDDLDDVMVGSAVAPAVPEPSTYLMLVAGVVAIAFSAARRLHR